MRIQLYSLGFVSCILTAAVSARADAVGGGVATPTPAAAVVASTNGGGPQIQFAAPVYEFGKAKGGDAVKHDYVFTNTGDALLEITAAQPSCGCTTAGEWSRKVEPGKTGIIPVQFNTGNYSGEVAKTVTVTSNAKNQPSVVLQLKGTVWRPIDVQPNVAYLQLTSENISNATTQIRIVNNEETPLTLSAPEVNNRFYAVDLVTNKPGKEYSIAVKTVPPMEAGNLMGTVTVKTSSTNTPTLSVQVYAILQQAVVTAPDRILLPQGPLTNQWNATISIRNQLSGPLTLAEPSVNAEGVGVKVNELEPGRFFNVTLTFPSGYKMAPEDKVAFTVKSSNPQFQTIRVPIFQPTGVTRVITPPPPGAANFSPTGAPVFTKRAEAALQGGEKH